MNTKYKRIIAILILFHIILVGLTLTGKLNFLFNDASLRKGQAADFFAIYQAGDNATEGISLYEDTEGVATEYSYPFRYLPFIGYSLGAFLSLFSPFAAYGIWIVFYEGLIASNLFLTRKLISKDETFLLATVPWLLFSPYLIEIFMGQFSFLLASTLFITAYGLIKKNAFQYLYTLAPLVKPNALILTPMLLKQRKFKLLALTLAGIVVTSLSYFIFHQDDISVFMQNFKDVLYSHGGNFGFKSLYYIVSVRIIDVPLPRLWFLGFVVASGLITMYLTFIKTKDVVLQFVLWICYFFFIYKDVWEHHYVLMMPVFVLLVYKYKLTFKKLLSRKHITILISFLLIALPSIFSLQYLLIDNAPIEPDNVSTPYAVVYHGMKIAGVGIIYLWVLKRTFTRK